MTQRRIAFDKISESTDIWLTPPHIIKSLGEFDLDPCSPIDRIWDTAKHHYTEKDDGLIQEWFGRVYLNPPYNRYIIPQFMAKMAAHNNGIALIFARTENKFWFQSIWEVASSILFIKGRLRFHNQDGTLGGYAGAPSVLIAYGKENDEALYQSGINGKQVFLREAPVIIVGYSPAWKSVIKIAFSRLDEQVLLADVYKMVEVIAPDKIQKNKFYKEKIRQVLQSEYQRIQKGVYCNPKPNSHDLQTQRSAQRSLQI